MPVATAAPLEPGIGYGAPVKAVDTTTDGRVVIEGTSEGSTGDVTGNDSTGAFDVTTSALDDDVVVDDGEFSEGGVDSPEGRVDVTVLPARVLVRV